jgi:hypothetical protein
MPEINTFLARAWANDPLISMSLLPKKTQLDNLDHHTTPSQAGATSLACPQLKPSDSAQLEDLIKPKSNAASPLEPEESDSDLPSSVVEEIEVRS